MSQEIINMKDAALERDIENAIKGRGLRASMKQWEKERARRRRWRVVAGLSPIVAAACMVGVFFLLPVRYRVTAERWAYHQYLTLVGGPTPTRTQAPRDYYAVVQPTVNAIETTFQQQPTGANDRVCEAAAELQAAKYEIAMGILAEAREEEQQDEQTTFAIDMLEACGNMMLGDRSSAYEQLKKIKESDSPYAMNAQTLLDELQ